MTPRDHVPVLDERAVERLLTGGTGSGDPVLEQAMARMRTLADAPAPPPTAALADMLERGFAPTVIAFRRPAVRRRRWAARTGAGLVAAAASVVVAGTAAALPAPVQDLVADVVSALTPFELPRPPEADGPEPEDPGYETSDPRAPGQLGTPLPAVTSAGPTAPATGTQETAGADDPSSAEHEERDEQRTREEADEESQDATEDAAEDAAEQQRLSDAEAAEQQRLSDAEAAEQQRLSDEEAAEQQRLSDEGAAEG